MATKTIHVLIVDDHEVLRLGLRSALDGIEDIAIAGEAANATEAIDKAHALRPDVILMDVRLEGDNDASGIEACRAVSSELPGARVVMFSSFGDREAVEASIMAGAAGYLTKNIGRSQLIEAIRATARGESLLDPSVTAPVLERLRSFSEGQAATGPALSAREREVLVLVAEGLTNKEIAERLVVSEHTARNHVANILSKLGLSRRVQAATYAARLGVTDSASLEP
jgi:DNA-binding NarL/FixJ family response regulator